MTITAKQHLKTIAGRLMDGHACLFVGAGFSQNANRLPGGHRPADWNELGDLFIEKARGHKPNTAEREYANVLRLAEEVECVCGRDVLQSLIKEAINDDRLEPSDLFTELLSFPWKDVFTTNYDTLLDRASQSLNEQGKRLYSLVTTPQQIATTSQPFLMKLHGDIKEPDTIIITEEDYRTYPSMHQAMISHIQHSIMLETLVLIGFSGNDPNFIQWLGWVKDALNSQQRKVYLLSVDKMSESVIKTFEKKNVIVVALHDFAGKGANPHKNVSAAIHYIAKLITQREDDARRYRKEVLAWGNDVAREEDINKQYQQWKYEREHYPGWLLLPREKREKWARVGGFTLPVDKFKELKGFDDILYLDTFNWRIEKCLFPIDNNWESVYLTILDKYKPFERRSRKEVKDAWVNLKLGLLRLYRQEGWQKKWQDLNDELALLEERFSKTQQCRYRYEQCLKAVYQSDFERLKELLDSWPEQREDPYWDIRRGSLWAEYLSLETGKKFTNKALNAIKAKLNSATDEKDRYCWGSRLANAQTVWNTMAQANFSMNVAVTEEARSVWNELRPYEDIWYEREFFDTNIRSIEQTAQVKTKTAFFTLGHTNTSTNLSGNAMYYRVAYAFFLYYEETAFPIHLPNLSTVNKDTLKKALSVMEYCSPAIAECWLLRSGDHKVVDAVFNRRYLTLHSAKDITAAYQRYLGYLKTLLSLDEEASESSWSQVYRSILPEILSRLCMKVPFEIRSRTFEYINKVFKSKHSARYEGVGSLLSSLISTFSNDQISKLIPMMVGMAVGFNRLDEYKLEPFSYLHEPEIYNFQIDSAKVESIFGRLGKNEISDKALVYRLLFLMRAGALDDDQKRRLMDILWAKTDASGFPVGTPFAKFAFLSMPHPENVDPQALLKDYFSKTTLPKMGKGSSISFYGGRIPLLNEIKGTNNDDVDFAWDEDLLNALCSDIVNLWESDKNRLTEKREDSLFSVREELEGRLNDIEIVLMGVVANNLSLVSQENCKGLAKMIDELENYHIPALRLRVALASILEQRLDIDHEIKLRLGSADERVIENCVKTIVYLDMQGQNVSPYVELMAEYFRGDAVQGKKNMISGLNYFMEKKGFVVTDPMRENLILGLGRLLGNTNVDITDSELEINNKLHLRLMVATIVRKLVDETKGRQEEILSQCKTYYESKETCWDIRNRYYNGN